MYSNILNSFESFQGGQNFSVRALHEQELYLCQPVRSLRANRYGVLPKIQKGLLEQFGGGLMTTEIIEDETNQRNGKTARRFHPVITRCGWIIPLPEV